MTQEAFLAHKPVITGDDSGAVLEFVEDGITGCVTETDPKLFAEKIDMLFEDRALCQRLGKEGYRRVKDISWQNIIRELVGDFEVS